MLADRLPLFLDDRSNRWGGRGEAWVLVQTVLMLLAAVGGVVGPRLLRRRLLAIRLAGLALGLGGSGVMLAGGLRLGPNLTPLPRPRADATLVQEGIYGVVRHPIYSGASLLAFGWALLTGRWIALLAALAIGLFFDAKATREEAWLVERFPEYPAYRDAVAKLVPRVY